MNRTRQFITELSKTKKPEYFLGVARILKAKLVGEDGTPRPFEDVLGDVIDNFSIANKKRQREVLSLLREANKEDEPDATRTENTETSSTN